MPFGRVLTPETVKKFRADFLLLFKNLKRIKDYKQALTWHEAMQRWRDNFDGYIESAIKELGRYRSDELSPSLSEVWQRELRTRAHPLVHEMYSSPFELYELATRYTYRPHDRKAVEEQLYRDFLKEFPKYDRRVKRVARKVWSDLDSLLTSMQHSWEEQGLKGLDVPQKESFQHLGFHVTLLGYSDRGYKHRESVGAFKAALKHYRDRAKKVYPWLLRYQLPMTLSFEEGLGAGGEYLRDTIMVNGNETNVKRQAHVVAHEMGHHIYKVVLSKADRDYWDAAIHGSKGPLDLREVVKLPGSDFIALDDDLRRRDPILALRLETMIKDDMGGGGYRGRDLATKTDIQEYLDAGGDPVIQVTTEPITGYAAKNTEEAFCEALGLLVAYGPRAVLPVVRRRLKAILPQLKVTARVQASKADVQVLEAKLKARHGVQLSLYENSAGIIILSKVIVPKEKRGGGVGTAFMKDLCRFADEHNQVIALTPSSDFGGSKTRLVRFYRQFGFKPNKGRAKDFRTSETMIRVPTQEVRVKKQVIAALLRARRPDLANVVAHLVIAMSVDEALELLELKRDQLGDKKVLKEAYRRASMKHHPDRGGDLATMQKVNQAYKLLQNVRGTGTVDDQRDRDRRNQEAQTIIRMGLERAFQAKAFTEYFEKVTGQKYTLVVNPKGGGKWSNFVGFQAEWTAVNADTVFTVNAWGNPLDVMYTKKLGGGDSDISFNISVTTSIFHGNRKVKMFQSDWRMTDKHRVIMDPKELFPTAKLKRMMKGKERARKFSRRDMILGLEKKLGGQLRGSGKDTWVYVPVGKDPDLKAAFYRVTMMRVGSWGLNGIYRKHRRVAHPKSVPMAIESEALLDALIAAHKKVKGMDDPQKIADTLGAAIDAHKGY